MSLPVFEFTALTTFDVASPLQPIEAFHFAGNDYIGVQTLFPADEISWDADNFGRWQGPAPLHSNIALSIAGATTEMTGHDVIVRVGTSALTVVAIISERSRVAVMSVRFVLQDATSGAVLSDNLISVPLSASTITSPLAAFTDGNKAILWARVEGAVAKWELPPDYYEVTGYASYDFIPDDYKYVQDDVEYVWDWLRDVGLRPSDPDQQSVNGIGMYDARQALVVSNSTEDRGEWTTYIRSLTPQICDWSALRIISGDDDWVNADITPYPGAALLRKNGANRDAVNFDPLARSVGAFDYDDGGIVLAGSIASSTGALLALWRMESAETATLLGTHPNTNAHLCEMALLSNFASDTILTRDSKRLVLSLAGLHEYDETKPIPEALPGIPRETEGHPGGRCLREHPATGQVLFLTENFSGPPNFYNRLQEQVAGRRGFGPGTVFHGHNSADVWMNRYYGIHQDKPFSESDATQYISFLQEGAWNDSELTGFPAAAYHWQRVRTIAAPDGLKLLVSGKAATDENAIWGALDGYGFKEGSLSFRPRRLTRTLMDDGTERIYAVGRFVQDGAVSLSWSVISMTGGFKKVCTQWDDDTSSFVVARSILESAGFDVDKLPAYLWWQPDTNYQAGGVWLQKPAPPEDGVYLTKVAGASLVKFQLTSGALPYDPNLFDRICFTLYDDGGSGTGAIPPVPSCDSADCPVIPGAIPLFLSKPFDNAGSAIQLSDVSDIDTDSQLRRLHLASMSYPLVWCRVDSDADLEDLSTYRTRINFQRYQTLPTEAKSHIDVVVLVPPGIGTIRIPEIDKRE